MQLSELIEQLKQHQKAYGDVTVYTNGEYGIEESKELFESMIGCGTAEITLPDDFCKYNDLEPTEIVMHIGGY